jgi:hypothetical protein
LNWIFEDFVAARTLKVQFYTHLLEFFLLFFEILNFFLSIILFIQLYVKYIR